MFPTNTSHRAIGQTDTPERIVLNFNFIKSENVTIWKDLLKKNVLILDIYTWKDFLNGELI